MFSNLPPKVILKRAITDPFSVFSSIQYKLNWLDPNSEPLLLEATAQSTLPQPLPTFVYFF